MNQPSWLCRLFPDARLLPYGSVQFFNNPPISLPHLQKDRKQESPEEPHEPLRNESEHSPKKILGECSDKALSTQHLRPNIDPIYHFFQLLHLPCPRAMSDEKKYSSLPIVAMPQSVSSPRTLHRYGACFTMMRQEKGCHENRRKRDNNAETRSR